MATTKFDEPHWWWSMIDNLVHHLFVNVALSTSGGAVGTVRPGKARKFDVESCEYRIKPLISPSKQ
jgi:hypothetical protein